MQVTAVLFCAATTNTKSSWYIQFLGINVQVYCWSYTGCLRWGLGHAATCCYRIYLQVVTLAKTHNRFPRASPGVPDCTPSSPGHWKPPSEAPYSYNLFLTLNTYYFSVSHCRTTEILKTTFAAVSVLTNPPIQLIHRLRSESLLSSAKVTQPVRVSTTMPGARHHKRCSGWSPAYQPHTGWREAVSTAFSFLCLGTRACRNYAAAVLRKIFLAGQSTACSATSADPARSVSLQASHRACREPRNSSLLCRVH